jgi:hypothetical protein
VWEDDAKTVEPIALAVKQSLLHAIPHIIPPEDNKVPLSFVLEYGDFDIYNTSITEDENGEPLATSLYDWEIACIAPVLLSDPLVTAGPVDLVMDTNGKLSVARIPENSTPMDLVMYII